jgi:predicted O-linked N-acetylglucosamine transferase (SPINDLY family)
MVFARKPAPVQVFYLAYTGTTGLRAMDYRLTDRYLDPPDGDDQCYCETPFRLAETYWCYVPPDVPLDVAPLPALRNGYVTFGSLNNFSKNTRPTLATWCRVLQQAPDARLVLHALEGIHRQRVREIFAAAGIEPDRISFVKKSPLPEYLSSYGQIDLGLDPFPYCGGTTTCDALWMGVPVVSLAGQAPHARGGASVLSNVGLPELVAQSEDEYVAMALELAKDLPRLAELRSTLRQRMLNSPLTDAPAFARSVESAYRQMWRRWCAQVTADE